MVKFNDGLTEKFVARKSLYLKLCVAAFVTALCCGAVAASLTAQFERFAPVIFALLSVGGVALIGFIIAFTLLKIAENRLCGRVKETLSTAMQNNSDILAGDAEIAFTAAYSGDNVTLSRENSFKEIVFDLTGIRKTKAYSYFGTYLAEYLNGFYALHVSDGYQNVTVCDNTGKGGEVLRLVQNGAAPAVAEKNYFIKRGLIK